MARLQIAIRIPDDKQQDVIDTLLAYFGWRPSDGEKRAFLDSRITAHIKDLYISQKEAEARQTGDIDIDSLRNQVHESIKNARDNADNVEIVKD